MGHLGVDWKRLRRFLHRVHERFPLERVLLFGSRARGDELETSDYDLLLVSEAFRALTWRERLRQIMDLWDLEVDLQPLCYTPEEFVRKRQELCVVAEAVESGQALWPEAPETCPPPPDP
ncbi:MAG: nucleotidyltransferase domain-containing protein [Armatimonadota bacterium]|nr:nucleotidyltransferase domain-containing protein [Armatimonadota bacterium]MDR7444627.1 nucleotidyltransferase domain-containing protein [Armatimonadota bacterium]MDR7569453.1 nucleotidyltransferase domain-containing protein [Armatimonadota bacterium]MDR7613664.1 nucleotidyltransferase domain-containing protein [Armatimonadota bacterium]